MAQRKKRPAVRKEKSTTRRKAGKPSKAARERPLKRTVARATPRKRMAKARLKGGAKKPRIKVRAKKPPTTPVVETVVVDVVEEPMAGVTASPRSRRPRCVRRGRGPEEPEERRSAPELTKGNRNCHQPRERDDPFRALKAPGQSNLWRSEPPPVPRHVLGPK